MSDTARAAEAVGDIVYFRIQIAELRADIRHLERERERVKEIPAEVDRISKELEHAAEKLRAAKRRLRLAKFVLFRIGLLLTRLKLQANIKMHWHWRRAGAAYGGKQGVPMGRRIAGGTLIKKRVPGDEKAHARLMRQRAAEGW